VYILVEKPEGKMAWIGFIWLKMCYNGGNEPLSSIKGGMFLEWLSDC
jgi:hypothetical protein